MPTSVLIDKLNDKLTITSQRVFVIPPQFYDSLEMGVQIRIEEDDFPEQIEAVSQDKFRIRTWKKEFVGRVPSVVERVYERKAEVEDLGFVYGEVSRNRHLPSSRVYALFEERMKKGQL